MKSDKSSGNGGSCAPISDEVGRALLRFLQSSNNSQVNLTAAQKRIPLQFLALRNAHGDYGESRDRRALMPSPILNVCGTGSTSSAILHFVQPLPLNTTKVILQGHLIPARSYGVDSPEDPADIELHTYGDDVAVVQTFDAHDVLLSLGVPKPTVENPERDPLPESLS